jgi:uncharacterized protein (DUF885 family)
MAPTSDFMLRLPAIALALLLAPSLWAAGAADQQLRALYEREWEWQQAQDAQLRDGPGTWVDGDHLPDVDAPTQTMRLAHWESVREELDGIDAEALSADARINAEVFRQILDTRISRGRYRTWEAPLNSDTFFWAGLHPQLGGFSDLAAYERYLGRMADIPRFFAEQQANMRAGLARGFTPPRITLQDRERSIESYLAADEANPFWGPLAALPDAVAAGDRERLQGEARRLIREAVAPAYAQLLDFMREEYLPGARTTLAAADLPDGRAFYRAEIRAFTTLALSPREIHDTGLAEVARIRGAMEEILGEVDFDGDMAAFFEFLRTDPQFYATTPDELMGVSAYVAKRMDGRLADILGFLPRRRFAIRPVPDAIAPIYTGGRGGLDACLMNTWNLPARPLYTLPALTLHECAPGHALQAAIAREAPGDIPEFRAHNYFSGYGEGWGLYTEWLGGEIGIYRTPYERFGQLTYEMWRACRLVIDTGVHEFGWSRERAMAYLRDNAPMSEHEITTEIDRYISWPGQALAYKLGEMLIREKRRAAEEALGADFDQRHFHDFILALRSVPLSVLGAELDGWIAAGGPNPFAAMDAN